MGGTTTTTTTPRPALQPNYPPAVPIVVEPSSEKPTLLPDTKKIFETIASHMAKLQLPSPSATPNRKGEIKRVNYDDYQIWRVLPSTHQHLEYLREYKESDSSERVLWLKGPSMRLLYSNCIKFHFYFEEFGQTAYGLCFLGVQTIYLFHRT